jgi:hypothetical protein
MSYSKPPELLQILCFLVLLSGCQSGNPDGSGNTTSQSETRERVIERYSGGEKKVVAVYQGEGTEEELLRRITYTKTGNRIRVENKKTGSVKDYGDLNPQYSDPDSLRNFLSEGVWVSSSSVGNTEYTALRLYESERVNRFLKIDDVARRKPKKIEYLENFRIVTEIGDVDTVKVVLIGPNKISVGGSDPYTRVKIDEIESEILEASVEKYAPE